MSLRCPECGSGNLSTERRLNGETRCLACGYRDLTSEFYRHNETPSYLELEQRLKEAEAALRFYGNGGNPSRDIWIHKELGYFTGKRAREYQEKYLKKEEA